MHHYKERRIPNPSLTEIVLDKVTCDFCSALIKSYATTIDKVVISHECGNRYPDCGNSTERSVDMCSVCFDSKFVPWVESQGATFATKERDW